MDFTTIKTLGELKKSKYNNRTVKQELRDNLVEKLKKGEKVFDGIIGFDHTVIPDIQRAILSSHNILLLGLRGQAKTRIARLLTQLLDEYIPIIEGSELNDDPFNPLSRNARDIIAKNGDDTKITWIHRDERYVEKLATPDVSVADLIGDVDPIKAASLKLPYSDERVIHFGLVPRANKSIFVINELPDLQPRIQVSLFNILQEGDIQIRGFKLRMPLDMVFIFTANPEDYTNRGSIITPLKDRIESQILTHYPVSTDIAKEITRQEANLSQNQSDVVGISEMVRDVLEKIVFNARTSEYIDEKSGVSARMSISALENLVSSAERRALINGDKNTKVRITDFWGIIPAITGKAELVYEGEQEGPHNVAMHLIQDALEDTFDLYFPNPDNATENNDEYEVLRLWFSSNNAITLSADDSDKEHKKKLDSVPGLKNIAREYSDKEDDQYFMMELLLNGLASKEVINFDLSNQTSEFRDMLSDNLSDLTDFSGDMFN